MILKFGELINENKMWYKTIPEILSWLESKSALTWIWIDTETTGLNGPKIEQLTQVSVVQFMKEGKSGSLYKYGCVMLELNIQNWDDLTKSIDPNDVYLPEDPSHGIETDPHVTILYGLHRGVTPEQVKSAIS